MDNPPKVGQNILKIRSRKKLTLNALSERSGISKGMLSQIESEKANPTVATVWKIARGLNVSLNDVLEESAEEQKLFSVNPAGNENNTIETTENGVTIHILSPMSMVEDLEMYYCTFEPHSKLSSEPHYEGTTEFLTIIKGTVKVYTDRDSAELKKGEFIMYRCDVNHTIENASGQTAIVHMVVRYAVRT
ncbi:MAG: XRE family transcriptional regulator [Sphaerochaetaceae bacterium]